VKRVIVEAARANGWHAKAEFDGLSSDSEPWSADVLLTKGSVRIAIEVQWSKQSQEETARRQSRYASSGVRGLWLFRQARLTHPRTFPLFWIGGNPLDG
jgi:competence protein CoiA